MKSLENNLISQRKCYLFLLPHPPFPQKWPCPSKLFFVVILENIGFFGFFFFFFEKIDKEKYLESHFLQKSF